MSYTPDRCDPLSTEQITRTVCEAFERQPLISMRDGISPFEGSGLYALYYAGDTLDLYRPLSRTGIPLHVGRSATRESVFPASQDSRTTRPLHARLRRHRAALMTAQLPLDEFQFRALLVPEPFARAGELALLTNYRPLWNSSRLSGFSSVGTRGVARAAERSRWEAVHDVRGRTGGRTDARRDKLIEQASAHIRTQIRDTARSHDHGPASL